MIVVNRTVERTMHYLPYVQNSGKSECYTCATTVSNTKYNFYFI